MVASGEPPSPKVPLLAKFGKARAPLINSVSFCKAFTKTLTKEYEFKDSTIYSKADV